MRKYTVICEWSDAGPTGGFASFDAEDVIVHADSASSALAKAKKKWRLTVGPEWPTCRLTNAYVLTARRFAEML
jgi:hypothetical protein